MKITTKTGDKGESSLYNGKRLKKSDYCMELLGEIDELSSFLGWTKSETLSEQKEKSEEIVKSIDKIQDDLYRIMGFVGFEWKYSKESLTLLETDLEFLEALSNKYMQNIPEIKEFLRPGDGRISSMFHVCRTVCRRAERSYVRARAEECSSLELRYLNRLSDLLFVFAVYFRK